MTLKAGVIVFPGSNCDRDVACALSLVTGTPTRMIWHGETDLPALDLIVLPGGFSYGDYLRCGAIAVHSPIMEAVIARARAGTPVLGICNGFQMLTETGLLPGVLMRNRDLTFVSRTVDLSVANPDTPYTAAYGTDQTLRIPIAHHDGNYLADDSTLDRLEGDGRVVLRYLGANPNGSARDIAGITDETGRILGLMPHPERAVEPAHGSTDGRGLFESIAAALG
ncbi:MAG: phosphoribosylformylglycinamidine synthase subunit PurQ [Alphaproteobacteria bacterium]